MALEAQNNPYPSILIAEHADPESIPDANPAAGFKRLVVKDDLTLWLLDDTGTATEVGGGSGMTDPMTTRGDIIYRNSSNTTARLGRGTASQVLTSDGTDIAWGTPTSGALVLLQSQTASASATLDFASVVSSTYDVYKIFLVDVTPATNTTDLYFRVTTDNGSTYLSTSVYTYDHLVWRTGGSAVNGSTTAVGQLILSYHQAGADHVSNATAGEMVNGELTLYTPAGANAFTFINGQLIYRETAGPFRVENRVRGAYEATTNITGFRFLMSSGNLTSGTIRVYGVAK